MSKTPVMPERDIPSKWDIMPVHASDVAAFKRCRRYWDWSSPTRTNLRRRTDIHGIYFPLWFGSGAHYALQCMYDPVLPRDPVEAFITWYEYQWNGGIVTEDWLEHLLDNEPRDLGDGTFKVRGLIELLPDPMREKEEFEYHRDLGIGMMEFYKEYAEKNDDFVVVAAETMFSVPLGFEVIDKREDSPNYGNKIEVHARGKRDAILYNPDTERYGFMDHKTAGEIGDSYFTKLELDEQVLTYFWATEFEAEVYDMPYKRIDRVIYNVLRKAYPKPPTVLKDGFSPSINRKEEMTTAALFAKHIKDYGIEVLYENDVKWQAYYNWLNELGDSNFIQRKSFRYNQHQVNNSRMHYTMVAKEMLSEDLQIYPTPSGNWLCTNCQFRAPCIAVDDGSDWLYMLSDGYEENRGR